MNRILFIVTQPPYETFLPQEFLDMILAAASFGLQVAVVFCDSGVLQLQEQILKKNIVIKSLFKQIKAFPDFGIEDVYVINPHNISLSEQISFTIKSDLKNLLSQYEMVIYDKVD